MEKRHISKEGRKRNVSGGLMARQRSQANARERDRTHR